MRIASVVSLVLAVGLVACSGGGSDNQAGARALTVFAAASLTDAFEEMAAAFETNQEGVDVQFSFASSGTLATQIIEGAAADVFASANPRQMTNVQEAGLLKGEPAEFARNRLVVIASRESAVTTLAGLAHAGVKLVVAAPGVPIREYTEAMLAALGESAEYGPAFTAAVRANIVSEEPDARQAALKVALGEADAGVVYASDVTPDLAEAVRVIAVPDAHNVVASYLIGVTSHKPLARAFVDFTLSSEGQAILAGWGFSPANA